MIKKISEEEEESVIELDEDLINDITDRTDELLHEVFQENEGQDVVFEVLVSVANICAEIAFNYGLDKDFFTTMMGSSYQEVVEFYEDEPEDMGELENSKPDKFNLN